MQALNALDVTIYPHYIEAMRDQNFSARVSTEFLLALAALRKMEPDLPSQTEMLHRLVERASVPAHSAKALAMTPPRRS